MVALMPGGPFYQSKEWRRLRHATLQRDPVCVVAGCQAPSVVADHITPRSKGGADSLANLRGLCIPCHNSRRYGGEPRAMRYGVDGWPLARG